jgi:benzylsuccinate CoA-transferase BbsF subunit
MTMSRPLEGLKVVDMGWLMVGPESARYLGDLGADVIKVESAARRDPLRTLGPFVGGRSGLNRSLSYHTINAGKRSIALDIKHPHGREVLLKLARWADVLVESFSPGVIDRLKLSFSDLARENPRLIMLSTSLLGATGPETVGTSGTGTIGAALAGATNLLGWQDRAPAGPFGPWTDSVAPRFVVASLLAALHERRKSGRGCHIDAAQVECGIQFLMPAYYEYAVNGEIPQRRGAPGSSLRCPSGVFRCEGDDRWVAIDASEHTHWTCLRSIVGADLTDVTLDTLVGRLRHRARIERAISAWTARRTPQAVEERLQQAGISAHVVSTSLDLASDADLHHQDYYRRVTDPEMGEIVIRGPQYYLDRTPLTAGRPGPHLGASTSEILTSICGLNAAEVSELRASGALR